MPKILTISANINYIIYINENDYITFTIISLHIKNTVNYNTIFHENISSTTNIHGVKVQNSK